ncbi:transcription initiation factor TFIID subunit 15-like [Zingiber officinale]|nr:transcription initiation factor TFIID subunit 15-like [Zingiber officinale]
MSRKSGDWICRWCQYDNFCRRDACVRCHRAKLGCGEREMIGGEENGDHAMVNWDVKPGDWHCACCGVNNFASRDSCFKCGACRDGAASAVAQSWGSAATVGSSGGQLRAQPAGWKSGDWICTWRGCNKHNYARRMECFWCNTPRNYSE